MYTTGNNGAGFLRAFRIVFDYGNKRAAFAPHTAALRYGHGWVFTESERGTTIIWHDGSNQIFNAFLRRYVDEGVVLVIAADNASRQAEREIGKLEGLILGNN